MKPYILNTGSGDSFDKVAQKGKSLAIVYGLVEFDFNEVKCLVNEKTNLEYLYRDYANSWTMEWKMVGPECAEKYSPKVQKELDKRNAAKEKKRAAEEKIYKAKEEKERFEFEEKVKGIHIELKDETGWNKSREANVDPYGKCCIDYAEAWAKLMQIEISKGKSVKDCAKQTSHQLGFFGITGFMYGAAVATLSHCWKYGEDLKKWHNKEYNHEGDGVVNPAILTISV